ncbi:DnaJ C-terminal domain-containing protein [Aquabacterium sp.]|uniref:DnaJ C-terminal domain-containing protein n=1 Tax=Aquabacterium sp. TaxID=1872578 RepID=UPI0037837A43
MEYKDYYQLLGVARDATAEDIKKAFRRLARKYHPDVSKEADAAARMSEVNEAYAVLSDPERRAAYDALGRGHRAGEAFTPPPDWDAGFEFSGRGFPGGGSFDDEAFSDFFAELFGRMGHPPPQSPRGAARGAGAGPRSRRRTTAAAMAGEDHHARIVLDLADAFSGATRELTLRNPQLDDEGRVVLKPRTLSVRIPRGVRPGQMIRLAGQGGAGSGGAPAGDLLLEVAFAPHPRFRVEGPTLSADLPVAPWEAALGAVVPVEMPDGSTLKVRVPADAQSGRVLRVRGHGLPGREPGDLELRLQVVLPSAWDPRAKALYEQMARELADFDARKVAAAEARRGDGDGD